LLFTSLQPPLNRPLGASSPVLSPPSPPASASSAVRGGLSSFITIINFFIQGYADPEFALLQLLLIAHEPEVVFVPARGGAGGGGSRSRQHDALLELLRFTGRGGGDGGNGEHGRDGDGKDSSYP
jgi:hypothetical protein